MKKRYGIFAVVLAIVMALVMVLPVMAVEPSITPSAVDAVVFPGQSIVITKTVQTPEIVPMPDIYFLCDTTGSMGGTIDTVKANAATILADIAALDDTAQFGVGNYKDFPYDVYAFQPQQSITGCTTDVQTAINAWFASGGVDGSEAQLYALYEIATVDVGWRADSSRIVVWFGDWPGHDPIPAVAPDPDLGFDITEAVTTDALVAAGIHVVAIDLGVSPYGLNGDPTLDAYDYATFYPGYVADGSAGQATRIAAATGGVVLSGVSPEDVVDAIMAGITALPVEVSMTTDAVWPLEVTFEPVSVTVTSGEIASFTETITVAADAPGGIYTALDWALIGGEPMVDESGAIIYETKTIRVPEGFLTGGGQINTGTGTKKTDNKVSFAGNLGYMADFSMVGNFQMNFHNVSVNSLDGAQFHSTDIVQLQFFNDGGDGPNPPPANANVAYFEIDGRLNTKDGKFTDGYTIYAYVADRGEPGRNDSINFALWYGGAVVYSSTWDFPADAALMNGDTVGTLLDNGNLQIHSGIKGSVIPTPGEDIVVFNDINPFDNNGMSNANNPLMVTNLVDFTNANPRGSGTVVWFDRGRNSVCTGTGECNDANLATMRSTINTAGYSIDNISSTSGSITSIPAAVKVVFLWNPMVPYTTAEINVFKQFAGEGGRLVFVGEWDGYYGSGIALENQFLLDMGAVMTNIGNAVDCGYNDLPAASLRPHQITTGMTGVRIACASVIVPGPQDYPLFYDSTNTMVLAAVAKIDTTPLPLTLEVQTESLPQTNEGLFANASTGICE